MRDGFRAVRRSTILCFVLMVASGCGNFTAPTTAVDSDGREERVVEEHASLDIWSLVHFASGYYLGEKLGEDRVLESMGWLVLYEVAEPRFWPYFGENPLNQQCDIVVGGLGLLVQQAQEND